MPLAVTRKTERFDLKTVEGGYVVVRRFTHGERQERRALGSKVDMRAGSKRDLQAQIDMFNATAENFELARGVVEHNLTYLVNADDPTSEAPLDFRNPSHLAMVDGIVLEEIGMLIDKMNNFEDDEEAKKLSGSYAPTS
jgi:hypothetical protein